MGREDEIWTRLFRLQGGDEDQGLLGGESMVSRSFRPNTRRTQRSKFVSVEDEEQNSVRFLHTLLLV